MSEVELCERFWNRIPDKQSKPQAARAGTPVAERKPSARRAILPAAPPPRSDVTLVARRKSDPRPKPIHD